MSGSCSEAEYERAAPLELKSLLDTLDTLGDDIDPELAGDVLTIEFAEGSRFVINSHRAARQIWVAAGSSAWHFDYQPVPARWVVARTGEELWGVLKQELERRLARTVALTHPTPA